MATVPTYAELDRPDETGLPLAWGVWGADDQVGTLNHITEEKVRQAAGYVRRGTRFNLDLPLHEPYGTINPEAHALRRHPEHTILVRDRPYLLVRDDTLNNFWPQGSSQWDGLTHMGDPRHGFYNGVQAEQVNGGEDTRNGIDQVVRFGLVSRGVLVDLPRFFAAAGKSWDIMAQQVASADDLAGCLAHQGVELEPGDVLLVRLGWVEGFRAAADATARDGFVRPWAYSGLSGQEDMWEFLWDQGVAALASDSVTVEVWPLQEGRPSLHLSIARLGLTIGEMFDFEALAADCAADGEYRCMFTSSPLYLRGGVGSPPNAIAIK